MTLHRTMRRADARMVVHPLPQAPRSASGMLAMRFLKSTILGIAITVLIAWVSVFIVRLDGYRKHETGVVRAGVSGATETWTILHLSDYSPPLVEAVMGSVTTVEDNQRSSVFPPPWSFASNPPSPADLPADGIRIERIEVARGWPWRALKSVHDARIAEWQHPGRWKTSGGVNVAFGEADFEGVPKAIPLTPIIAGFTSNTVVYASMCFGLLITALHLRGRHRERHQRCVRCAYDLQNHSPADRCPECGAGARSARTVQ